MANISLGAKTGFPVVMPIITDYVSYTPTSSWTTNATHSGMWRRIGSTIELKISITLTGAPTGTLSFTSVQLLNGLGLTYGSAAIPSAANKMILGRWHAVDTGVADYVGELSPSDATSTNPSFFAAYQAGAATQAGSINATAPFTFGTGDKIGFELTIPIAEWLGNANQAFGAGQATSAKKGIVGGYNGALPGVGDINEIIYLTQSTPTNVPGASTVYGNILTINNSTPGVTNGLYLLNGLIVVSANGATSFLPQFAGVSDFSGNTTTDHVFYQNMMLGAMISSAATDSGFNVINQPINVTNGSNKYIKIRVDYASGTPQYRYGFRLLRIG